MPYNKESDLPKSVKDNLPKGAQDIYMNAYTSAYKEYKDPEKRRGEESQEEAAAKVDWAGVKKKFEKSNGKWRAKKK